MKQVLSSGALPITQVCGFALSVRRAMSGVSRTQCNFYDVDVKEIVMMLDGHYPFHECAGSCHMSMSDKEEAA